jgi:hypothetical protein
VLIKIITMVGKVSVESEGSPTIDQERKKERKKGLPQLK